MERASGGGEPAWLPGGLRGGADFAMFFLGVAVDAQGVAQGVVRGEGGGLMGEERRNGNRPRGLGNR